MDMLATDSIGGPFPKERVADKGGPITHTGGRLNTARSLVYWGCRCEPALLFRMSGEPLDMTHMDLQTSASEA